MVTESLDRVMTTVSFNEFINNRVSLALTHIQYSTTTENLTNNVFIDYCNRAAFDIATSTQPVDQALVFLWAVLVVFHALKTGVEI